MKWLYMSRHLSLGGPGRGLIHVPGYRNIANHLDKNTKNVSHSRPVDTRDRNAG